MSRITPEHAQEIAITALVWIAADPDRTGAFLGASGLDAGDIRTRAADPEFQGFVLDHLTMGDEALLAFCQENGLNPDQVIAARAALPGGGLPHWT